MSIAAAAKDARLEAATEAVLYRLDVTFILKDKRGHSSEDPLKEKKVDDCSLDFLWPNTTAASLWLDWTICARNTPRNKSTVS